MSDSQCTCRVCSRPAMTRGYCSIHYARLINHGDPLGGGRYLGAPRAFVERLLTETHTECVFWPFATSRGYAYMAWNGKYVSVSRLLCRLVHGDPPDESMQAAHRCGKGKKGCVNPACLYWATKAENEADKLVHGTLPRGDRSPASKVTDDQVAAIRKDNRRGKVIAKDYGISPAQVSRIKSGKSRA